MSTQHNSSVIELRRYVLQPGARETLIDVFDREFVETQEALGIDVVGQFRDLDAPDTFTWIRGFENMPSRANALEAFYTGPAWTTHRDVANATMIAWDNVRLLRPLRATQAFWSSRKRAGVGAADVPSGLVVATIYTLTRPARDGFGKWFDEVFAPRLLTAGGSPIATFETDESPNTFPRLPVREGEHAFVWFARFDDVDAHLRFESALANQLARAPEISDAAMQYLAAEVESWRLTPTARSRFVP